MPSFRAVFAPVLTGALTLVLLTACGDEPDRVGPPDDGPLALVTIGDSTLSGDGIGEYTPETDGTGGNWCHRSPKAAVHMTAIPDIERTINLACSGAATHHVRLTDEKVYTEGSQAAQLRELAKEHRIAGVVVAIGANDEPHFSQRITDCAKAWWGGPPCSRGLAPTWRQTVNKIVPKVEQALADVRGALTDEGYRLDDYQLIVQSYPSPVGPGIPERLRSLAGCPFQAEDLAWVSTEGVGVLNEAIQRAAVQSDARFLDLSRAGRGHEACAGGDNPLVEWFSRLTVRWDDFSDVGRAGHAAQDSFHGNARWHAQLAGCITEFWTTSDPVAACLEGDDGRLHASPVIASGE